VIVKIIIIIIVKISILSIFFLLTEHHILEPLLSFSFKISLISLKLIA